VCLFGGGGGGGGQAVKAIRMWHSAVGDDGACALAELLRLGGADVTIEYLEVRGRRRSKRSVCVYV
jgi:hypothetical protein